MRTLVLVFILLSPGAIAIKWQIVEQNSKSVVFENKDRDTDFVFLDITLFLAKRLSVTFFDEKKISREYTSWVGNSFYDLLVWARKIEASVPDFRHVAKKLLS